MSTTTKKKDKDMLGVGTYPPYCMLYMYDSFNE